MAILNCSADNADPESKISFEIQTLPSQSESASWLDYTINFQVGAKQYHFASIKRTIQTALGTEGEIGKFAFAIHPENELKRWIQGLESFIQNENQSQYRFEPSDPSFEFEIHRILDQFKVYIWIDAGNTSQLAYTWDALGIRFLTGAEELKTFIKELDQSSKK